jgi:hypothetical protein
MRPIYSLLPKRKFLHRLPRSQAEPGNAGLSDPPTFEMKGSIISLTAYSFLPKRKFSSVPIRDGGRVPIEMRETGGPYV